MAKKGFSAVTHEGKDPLLDIENTVEEGFMMLQLNRDWVVKAQKEKPKPDLNAVVTFVVDGSGSTAPYYPQFKRMVFDLKTLLKYSYRQLVFKFVVFDTNAHEVAEEKFFRIRLGGGTSHLSGIEKVESIYQNHFPRSQWDRFTFFFGDLEEGGQVVDGFQRLSESSEYVGVVKAGSAEQYYDLPQKLKNLSEDSSRIGYVDIGEDAQYDLEHLKKLLKNE